MYGVVFVAIGSVITNGVLDDLWGLRKTRGFDEEQRCTFVDSQQMRLLFVGHHGVDTVADLGDVDTVPVNEDTVQRFVLQIIRIEVGTKPGDDGGVLQTHGCVVTEAQACHIPAFGTNVPGQHCRSVVVDDAATQHQYL